MLKVLKNLVKSEEGQGMAEYGLIMAGIAVVVIVVIYTLGDRIVTLFEEVVSSFDKPAAT